MTPALVNYIDNSSIGSNPKAQSRRSQIQSLFQSLLAVETDSRCYLPIYIFLRELVSETDPNPPKVPFNRLFTEFKMILSNSFWTKYSLGFAVLGFGLLLNSILSLCIAHRWSASHYNLQLSKHKQGAL